MHCTAPFYLQPLRRLCYSIVAGLLAACCLMAHATTGHAAPAIASLTNLSVEHDAGLVAQTNQTTASQLHVLPGSTHTRLIWDFDHTNLGPMVSVTKLNQSLRQQGLDATAQILTYPGPSVRVILQVPPAMAQALESYPQQSAGLAHTLPLTTNTSTSLAYSTQLSPPAYSEPSSVDYEQPVRTQPASPPATTSGANGKLAELTQQLAKAEDRYRSQQAQWSQERQQLQQKIEHLSKQVAAASARAEKPVRTTNVASSTPAATQLAALKQTIEASKAALSKSVTTINQQNQAIQTLKQQIAELKQGVSVSSLDQQSYLDSELSKAQKRIASLQQRIHQLENRSPADDRSGAINAAAIANEEPSTYTAESMAPSSESTTALTRPEGGWVTLDVPKYEPFKKPDGKRLH